MRGGLRQPNPGGRPKGSTKPNTLTAQFTKRITPAEKVLLEEYLKQIRSDKND